MQRPTIVVSAAALLCCLWLCSCKSSTPPSERRPAVPVATGVAEKRTVPVELKVIGNVEPYSTVSIKAQVGGELLKVHFEEGQSVRQGQKLFELDSRPYELALAQAQAALSRDLALTRQWEANLRRDTALANQAEADAQRAVRLMAEGIISKELGDRSRTNATAVMQAVTASRASLESANTSVAADKVAIDRARLDLSYCSIQSPIDGRTGPVLVKAGNLVKANADSAMVVIHQVRPIYVAFAVPENQLGAVQKHMAERPLEVEAVVPGNPAQTARGRLSFVDNTVDSVTGTIRLKATFANADGGLWPGQFVDVTLTLTSERDVTLVPSEAVQNGPAGQFVYRVTPDQKVVMQPVSTGRIVGQTTVIEKGVNPGETVVTDGHLRLVPGAAIRVVASPGAQGTGVK